MTVEIHLKIYHLLSAKCISILRSRYPLSLYSLSHLYSLSSLPLLMLAPAYTLSLSLFVSALAPCPACPPVVQRSFLLAFIPPSLQSRADIGHEVREMGSHALAVSRLKWARYSMCGDTQGIPSTSLGLQTAIDMPHTFSQSLFRHIATHTHYSKEQKLHVH